MVNGFVAYDAAGIGRREVAIDAMAIEGGSPSGPVGNGLHIPVALEARFFFVADGAGLSVPRGLDAVGAALPGHGVIGRGRFGVAFIAELLLRAVTERTVGGIDLRFAAVGGHPYIGCIVRDAGAISELRNDIGAGGGMTYGAFVQGHVVGTMAVHAEGLERGGLDDTGIGVRVAFGAGDLGGDVRFMGEDDVAVENGFQRNDLEVFVGMAETARFGRGVIDIDFVANGADVMGRKAHGAGVGHLMARCAIDALFGVDIVIHTNTAVRNGGRPPLRHGHTRASEQTAADETGNHGKPVPGGHSHILLKA